ncbi:MAG: V-type ATP synthase subunit D [Candidatus Hodarchaeales archaeon]
MSQIKLTRVELQEKREALELAIIGKDLLEDRLGALISALMSEAQKILRSRQDLLILSRKAASNLALASALEREKLILASFTTPVSLGLYREKETIMGTKIHSFDLVENDTSNTNVLVIPSMTSQIAKVKKLFKDQIEILVELARLETIVRELGHEIKRVRHRFNALNDLLIPELKNDINKILLTLEEDERERNYKMRVFLKKRAKR